MRGVGSCPRRLLLSLRASRGTGGPAAVLVRRSEDRRARRARERLCSVTDPLGTYTCLRSSCAPGRAPESAASLPGKGPSGVATPEGAAREGHPKTTLTHTGGADPPRGDLRASSRRLAAPPTSYVRSPPYRAAPTPSSPTQDHGSWVRTPASSAPIQAFPPAATLSRDAGHSGRVPSTASVRGAGAPRTPHPGEPAWTAPLRPPAPCRP